MRENTKQESKNQITTDQQLLSLFPSLLLWSGISLLSNLEC